MRETEDKGTGVITESNIDVFVLISICFINDGVEDYETFTDGYLQGTAILSMVLNIGEEIV